MREREREAAVTAAASAAAKEKEREFREREREREFREREREKEFKFRDKEREREVERELIAKERQHAMELDRMEENARKLNETIAELTERLNVQRAKHGQEVGDLRDDISRLEGRLTEERKERKVVEEKFSFTQADHLSKVSGRLLFPKCGQIKPYPGIVIYICLRTCSIRFT